MENYKYKVIFDAGHPYEEYFDSLETLQDAIEGFYYRHKDNDYYFNVIVFNDKDEEINDTQLMQEMFAEIVENDTLNGGKQ
jgi:hypothetical protein